MFGSISGIIGTTLLYPTHLIKRVFQANSKLFYFKTIFPKIDDRNLKMISYMKDTVRIQGVRGLYKGMSITYVKIIPYQGLLFSTNEKLKLILGYEKIHEKN